MYNFLKLFVHKKKYVKLSNVEDLGKKNARAKSRDVNVWK